MKNPSKEYYKFKTIKENREVNPFRVKELVKSINIMDLTPSNPIIINENNEIIDGQHRVAACKILNKPIYWNKIELKNKSNEALILLNANQRNWKILDYINHYASKGIEPYILTQNLINEGHNATNSIIIVSQKRGGKEEASKLKTGNLCKGEMDIDFIKTVINDFQEICNWKVEGKFVRAVIILLKDKNYIHSKHFSKFEFQRYQVKPCVSVESYLLMFEEILNFKRHKKNRIQLL